MLIHCVISDKLAEFRHWWLGLEPTSFNSGSTVWQEIFAGQNFRGLAAGKDFSKIFSQFDDHKAQSTTITKFRGLNFCGLRQIRENHKNFVPRKFLAIRYSYELTVKSE